jgi:hypothetical protein
MRVLVCGGRLYNDRPHIFTTLTQLNRELGPFTTLIHGAASGTDTEAMCWAHLVANIPDTPYPANWKMYGRSAGHIRNKQMLTEGKPSLVIAFPGGRGTANMIKQAQAASIEVIVIEAKPPQSGRNLHELP